MIENLVSTDFRTVSDVPVSEGIIDSFSRFTVNIEALAGQSDVGLKTGLIASMQVKPSGLNSVDERFLSQTSGT